KFLANGLGHPMFYDIDVGGSHVEEHPNLLHRPLLNDVGVEQLILGRIEAMLGALDGGIKKGDVPFAVPTLLQIGVDGVIFFNLVSRLLRVATELSSCRSRPTASRSRFRSIGLKYWAKAIRKLLAAGRRRRSKKKGEPASYLLPNRLAPRTSWLRTRLGASDS